MWLRQFIEHLKGASLLNLLGSTSISMGITTVLAGFRVDCLANRNTWSGLHDELLMVLAKVMSAVVEHS
jgi:hypothetical protein